MTTEKRAPGPAGLVGIRNVVRYVRGPLDELRALADRYGDFVEMRVLGKPWILVSHPKDIEEALMKHAAVMGRDAYTDMLQRTLGLGILTSEGDLWKRQRRLMAQAFTPKRIRTYGETMAEVTAKGIGWRDGEPIDLHREMSRVTLEVVAAVLFGHAVDRRQVDLVHGAMDTVNEYYANSPEAMFKVPEWLPTRRQRALNEAVRQIDSIIYEIIAERRRGEPRDDLLGTLLAAVDDDGNSMTDRQLRDEAVTLFLAGHETTSLALAHTFYLVSKYPDVERRLLAEVDEVLGGRLPTAEDVKKLVYTERVLKESMRIYPPAWTVGREALEDVEVGGYHVKKGSQLLMSMWVVHRDPRWFPNPEAFDPDRWDGREKALPRFAYFPFGGGPRVCIGNHFAMMEAILMMATILSRHRFELLPGQRLELAPSVTLRPKGDGLKARVFSRPAERARVAPAPSARA